MTAEIVNLNKFRKAREKAEQERRAEENRVRFGRTQAEKTAESFEERNRQRNLEGARREDDNGDGSDPGQAS